MPKMLETISLLKIFYDFRHKYKDDLPKTKTTQRHTKDRNSERRCQRHRFQRQRCQRQVGRFPDVVLISRALTWSLKLEDRPRPGVPPLPRAPPSCHQFAQLLAIHRCLFTYTTQRQNSGYHRAPNRRSKKHHDEFGGKQEFTFSTCVYYPLL